MIFSLFRAVLSAILRDEYLTSAVRTKEGDKAGRNQPPRRRVTQSNLSWNWRYLISYLENTGSRSTRYLSRKIALKTARDGEKNMAHDSVNIFFKLLLKDLL